MRYFCSYFYMFLKFYYLEYIVFIAATHFVDENVNKREADQEATNGAVRGVRTANHSNPTRQTQAARALHHFEVVVRRPDTV